MFHHRTQPPTKSDEFQPLSRAVVSIFGDTRSFCTPSLLPFSVWTGGLYACDGASVWRDLAELTGLEKHQADSNDAECSGGPGPMFRLKCGGGGVF